MEIGQGMSFDYEDCKSFAAIRLDDGVKMRWTIHSGTATTTTEIKVTHAAACVTAEVLAEFLNKLKPTLAQELADEKFKAGGGDAGLFGGDL